MSQAQHNPQMFYSRYVPAHTVVVVAAEMLAQSQRRDRRVRRRADRPVDRLL